MIDLNQLAIGVAAGAFLMVLGLVPGLFQGLVEGVRSAIELWSSGFSDPPVARERMALPVWLAGLGAAIITATVLAFLST